MAFSVPRGIAAVVELLGVLAEVGDESEVEQAAEEGAVTDEPDVGSAVEEGVGGAADENVEVAAADDSAVDHVADLNEAVVDDRSPKSGVGQSWQSG